MTLTTYAWLALLAALGTIGVRAGRPRPVPAPAPAPASSEQPGPDDEGWHPRVTSGCGR